MAFLYFLGALLGIGVFAVLVNYVTRTKANYLDALQLAADEKQLWQDTKADFKLIQRSGRALKMSMTRLQRNTVVWTNHRVIIAAKTMFSDKRIITHQIYFDRPGNPRTAAATEIANRYSGGFFGRGYQTIMAQNLEFRQVNAMDCVQIQPTADCGGKQNIAEIQIFTDSLAELQQRLAANN